MGIGNRISSQDEKYNQVCVEASNTKKVAFEPMNPMYTLEDMILPQNVKDQVLDATSYIAKHDIVFETWGLKYTHKFSRKLCINLWGLPGTGKTMAAHAIASAMGKKIICINYADIESKYVGETSKNIRAAFKTAIDNDYILFFDEADAILSRRVTNMEHSTDVSVNQTRSQMLMQLNEHNGIVIFATNFIQNYDPAIMRRILMNIEFTLPDEGCRYKLWQKFVPKQMPNDFNFEYLAHNYDNLSGSDIENAVLAAAFSAARSGDSYVSQKYVDKALKNIRDSKKANESSNNVDFTDTIVDDSEVPEKFRK